MRLDYSPLARATNTITQDVDGDLLVYDMSTNKAIRLNATAAAVWRAADGTRTVSQIAAGLGLDAAPGVADDLVVLSLEMLAKEGLLQNPVISADGPRMSRREMALRLGAAAALALPLVKGLVVPTSAQVGTVPLACQSCIDSSNQGSNCGVCATVTGTCFNNNGCSNGGASISSTCTGCADWNFVGGFSEPGQSHNNTWKYVAV